VTVTPLGLLDVSSASGLVALDDRLFVVADDEHELCVYGRDLQPRARLVLFEGLLPDEHHERKAQKPDLEALTLLAPGTLLALGSGSTARRRRGVVIHDDTARLVDLAPLYLELEKKLPQLNIEGAAVAGDQLVLLSRGNAGINARIDLDLEGVRRAVAAGQPIGPALLQSLREIALGSLDGVPLGFTDASPLDGKRLLFTAAAEAGGSTYEDGACSGSVLGVLDGTRAVWKQLDVADKIEGVHAQLDGDRLEALLVADPDDRAQRAPLYRVVLSLEDLANP
jgi:hypothetical protein